MTGRTGPDIPQSPQSFSYTSFNLPYRIVSSAGTTNLSYDASEARVEKTDPVGKTLYVPDLYERRTFDAAPGSTEHVYRIYAAGREIAQLQRTEGPNAPADKIIYLHDDALGSTNVMTGANGLPIGAAQRFQPFGKSESPQSGAGVLTGFTGHQDDADLGLINMRGRIYDPIIGRFTTPDPLVQAPFWSQGLNRYSYAFNNPMKWVDPSGFDGEPVEPEITIDEVSGLGPTTETNGMSDVPSPAEPGDVLLNQYPTEGGTVSVWGPAGSLGEATFSGTLELQLSSATGNAAMGGAGGPFATPAGVNKAFGAAGPMMSDFGAGSDVTAGTGLSSSLAKEPYETKQLWEGGDCPPDTCRRMLPILISEGDLMRAAAAGSALWQSLFGSSVWNLSWAARGFEIERRLGGNLPTNFPVIDRFANGVATSIKSLDVTARSYQNVGTLARIVGGYVDRLAAFQGQAFAGVRVTAAEITGRTLLLAVPPGATVAQTQAFQALSVYAQSVGVTLQIVVLK